VGPLPGAANTSQSGLTAVTEEKPIQRAPLGHQDTRSATQCHPTRLCSSTQYLLSVYSQVQNPQRETLCSALRISQGFKEEEEEKKKRPKATRGENGNISG